MEGNVFLKRRNEDSFKPAAIAADLTHRIYQVPQNVFKATPRPGSTVLYFSFNSKIV